MNRGFKCFIGLNRLAEKLISVNDSNGNGEKKSQPAVMVELWIHKSLKVVLIIVL